VASRSGGGAGSVFATGRRIAQLPYHGGWPSAGSSPPTQSFRAAGHKTSSCAVAGTTQTRTLVRDLVMLKAHRALHAIHTAASSGWARRWWGMLSVVVQQGGLATARRCTPGSTTMAPPTHLPLRP